MISVDYRFDCYQQRLNEAVTKAEKKRAIAGFSTWLFNHSHITEVADRTPWFKNQIRMDKAAHTIK